MSPYYLVMDLWKQPLASMASRYLVQEPLSNSSWGKCNIVLSVARPPMCFFMFSALIYKSSLVTSCINHSMYLLTSNRTWFFLMALVRNPIEGILCVLTMKSKSWTTMRMKAQCWWWVEGDTHSSRSTFESVLCLALPTTSLSYASKARLPCTSLSIHVLV